ncbi:MAG TPA: DUF4202 domain-containing protein [Kofleriaceae bacterium]|nr:DUF4202 domain-containing protein [Kofleriaceae bacterium]
MTSRLDAALARFDAVNAEDPRRDGGEPAELVYARRMTAWLERLAPGAPEELRLAARAQHIGRWRLPRDRFPEGRAGYKRWRSACAQMHADTAAAILVELGYPDVAVQRVRALLTKKRLADDPDVQTLEDVACLVFLEHSFADFAQKHERDKLVDIVRKTWAKMSARGRAAAATLDLPPDLAAIVADALR